MLKSKIVTLGAAAVMGVTSLGVPQVIAHADTTKSGDTIVSYTGTAPQPKDWGISVPATVNLSETEKAAAFNNLGVTGTRKYGSGNLSIVDANGAAFEDPSGNRTFSVSGTSQVTANQEWLMMKDSNGNTVDLAFGVTDQGRNNPAVIQQVMDNVKDNNVKNLQNITFTSNSQGNTSKPLTRGVAFFANTASKAPLDLSKSYSDTISWTASETTPAQN